MSNRQTVSDSPQTAAGGRVRRGGARPTPERVPELAHVDLEQLRTYRAELIDEEAKVSYWRRLVQARLDVVRAVADKTASVDQLGALLSGPVVPTGRTSLMRVVAADDIPLLPDLAALWRQQPRPDDPAATEQLEQALTRAEALLSDYRSAVLQRLETATSELIARYHDEPTACLVALPLQ